MRDERFNQVADDLVPVDTEREDLLGEEVVWAEKYAMEGNYDFQVCPTCVDPHGPIQIQDAAASLVASGGIVSDAAKLLKRPRSRLQSFIERSPSLSLLQEDYLSELADEAHKLIRDAIFIDGDLNQAKFVLERLAKDRWSTQSNLKIEPGGSLDALFQSVGQKAVALPSEETNDE